jgi:hypothetical protein
MCIPFVICIAGDMRTPIDDADGMPRFRQNPRGNRPCEACANHQ